MCGAASILDTIPLREIIESLCENAFINQEYFQGIQERKRNLMIFTASK